MLYAEIKYSKLVKTFNEMELGSCPRLMARAVNVRQSLHLVRLFGPSKRTASRNLALESTYSCVSIHFKRGVRVGKPSVCKTLLTHIWKVFKMIILSFPGSLDVKIEKFLAFKPDENRNQLKK